MPTGYQVMREPQPVYGLHGISLGWHTEGVEIYWPETFGIWLDCLETDARAGDQRARVILAYTARALDQLRSLPEPPGRDSDAAVGAAITPLPAMAGLPCL